MEPIFIKAYLHSDKELYAEETPPFIDISPFGHLELKYGFI